MKWVKNYLLQAAKIADNNNDKKKNITKYKPLRELQQALTLELENISK